MVVCPTVYAVGAMRWATRWAAFSDRTQEAVLSAGEVRQVLGGAGRAENLAQDDRALDGSAIVECRAEPPLPAPSHPARRLALVLERTQQLAAGCFGGFCRGPGTTFRRLEMACDAACSSPDTQLQSLR